ncbi:rust resistance kinase Lr10-like [Papaver somniferum]|uniref:rust resistance kinase Lr10-like n=1 Tax=Papaver somniferum TaxID=3469 RepID=UPI000E6F589B|nr:rust resistance kinase Lr10-like [Papaver somniferum]
MVIIVIKIYKKAYSKQKENQSRIEIFLRNNALQPTRYSYAEIKKITNKYKKNRPRRIWEEGKLSNGIQVAVKVLNNSDGRHNGEEFVNEVAIIGKDKTPINLGWVKLQEIATGIARGMDYLHQGCDQRILHFDIKPQNILLDHNFTPKISDFGLAKLCTKDTFVTVSMAAARGTMGYIAPEVFSRNFGIVSYKSDVYSFGMLLLEIVGGKKNTKFRMETSDEEYFQQWIYIRLNRGENLGIHVEAEDLDIVKKLTMVALWCIQWNPVDRPSMNGVLHMLEGNTEKLLMAPNPFASTASVSNTSAVNHSNELTPILEDYE